MRRENGLELALSRKNFDLIVVGGGATGLGVGWDASTRGLSVLLLERGDFSGGTSSRSTKLIHGGIRYLAQGRLGFVRESLQEKNWLLQQAPKLVRPLRFSIPCRSRLEQVYYGLGTALYSFLDPSSPRSRWLSPRVLQERFPGLRRTRFGRGVDYLDAQFDDARMAVALFRQIIQNGGIALNYCLVPSLLEEGGRIQGVHVVDQLTGKGCSFRARIVVNATGVYSDAIRLMARPTAPLRMKASRGSHLVLRKDWLGSQNDALVIPRTEDGRVIFIIPWLGRTLIGTTDVEVPNVSTRPQSSREEVDYFLRHVRPYLQERVGPGDVGSVFAGYRPLIARPTEAGTSDLLRDFEIEKTAPGLLSVLGGKWTTFRAMAEATVDQVSELLKIPAVPCRTRALELRDCGVDSSRSEVNLETSLGGFPFSWWQVRQAIREEMAMSLEDVLARRTRCLFLDVAEALEIAPQVARFIADEMHHEAAWIDRELARFSTLAREYEVPSGGSV